MNEKRISEFKDTVIELPVQKQREETGKKITKTSATCEVKSNKQSNIHVLDRIKAGI